MGHCELPDVASAPVKRSRMNIPPLLENVATKRPSPDNRGHVTLLVVVSTGCAVIVIVCCSMSRTKICSTPARGTGAATRLHAADRNDTKRPVCDSDAREHALLASAPVELTLARIVVPATRSCTKMSLALLLSPETRLIADDVKATKRTSPLIGGSIEGRSASPPAVLTLARVVVPAATSRTKMSAAPLASEGSRSNATDWNTTRLPSSEISGSMLSPLACRPLLDTLIRIV